VRSLRIAIVGAGLAGLGTAAAFSRAGHAVTVFEQADTLRASGLAINLWSNATSLLPGFGIPADRIPGEPFSRMVMRASGRVAAVMDLPPQGLAHVTVERAELLTALVGALPADTVKYGTRCSDTGALAGEHDLVVVADGANSVLRSAVAGPPAGRRWTWMIWQACLTADVPGIPDGACANIIRSGFFSGIFRLPGGRVTWFAEQPGRKPGEGGDLLRDLTGDQDPVLRALARATTPEQWIEWRAEDSRPPRTLHRGNVVLAGDAAHAMLPTVGQGACQALEDAAVLAAEVTAAVAAGDGLEQALLRYDAARLPRVRQIFRLARAGALGRRPNIVTRLMPDTMNARLMGRGGAPLLRRVTRPVVAVPARSADRGSF
jgi:2-polyprenyl-6-methoxyphenol hydroxylase-like FAD-dependent oxidoreductase